MMTTTHPPEVLEQLRKLHRELAPSTAGSICQGCWDAGGNAQDIMFLLEHIIVAVLINVVLPDGYTEVLDALTTEVGRKLGNHRLSSMDVKGSA